MEGLLDLLLVICLIVIPVLKKKKKAQKKTARQSAAPQPAKPAGQPKIPFTKDEWKTFLADMEKQDKKPRVRPAKTTAARVPAPVLHIDHDEPEGTVSTQGESAAEHTAHRRKVLAEEALLREQQETLQELRRLNQQKLRSAVVMSEVLGKPVALRSRPYR